MMRRREFIAGLGAAAAWPFAARAQQVDRVRRIGVLMNLSANDPAMYGSRLAGARAMPTMPPQPGCYWPGSRPRWHPWLGLWKRRFRPVHLRKNDSFPNCIRGFDSLR